MTQLSVNHQYVPMFVHSIGRSCFQSLLPTQVNHQTHPQRPDEKVIRLKFCHSMFLNYLHQFAWNLLPITSTSPHINVIISIYTPDIVFANRNIFQSSRNIFPASCSLFKNFMGIVNSPDTILSSSNSDESSRIFSYIIVSFIILTIISRIFT